MATWMQRYPATFADGADSHPYLNLSAVRQALAEGVATKDDKWRLWRWINLEQWLQIWQGA